MENLSEKWIEACKTSDLLEGQIKVVKIKDRRIALCHVQGGGIYAVDDLCTHDNGPLGEGELFGTAIECPRHGARFDVRTGKVLCLPATLPIQTYPVQIEGDRVKIQIPSSVPLES
ncbi:MAG: non-heme iron oxygenase ferredoxin subunit [Candidatus Eremiobacteraeota bacterium]|nr:non-heme iron oxygenase ferredoxin subunit [Candidatus Eremiobacteraeota bacterium]MCL5055037.1 non-heme iron oxygenase ferredoxin subunit [Bacillota bacterium]